jgi:hypothetical protein
MWNLPKPSFSLFIQRGPFRLSLCDGLSRIEDATDAALEFAEIRFVGLKGMVICCESTGQQWLAEDLIASMDRPTVPTPCPKGLN